MPTSISFSSGELDPAIDSIHNPAWAYEYLKSHLAASPNEAARNSFLIATENPEDGGQKNLLLIAGKGGQMPSTPDRDRDRDRDQAGAGTGTGYGTDPGHLCFLVFWPPPNSILQLMDDCWPGLGLWLWGLQVGVGVGVDSGSGIGIGTAAN